MNDRDRIALEHWQSTCERTAERRLNDLTDTVDDLTTMAQNRAGAHLLIAHRPVLIEALKKLHDLAIETQPGPAE